MSHTFLHHDSISVGMLDAGGPGVPAGRCTSERGALLTPQLYPTVRATLNEKKLSSQLTFASSIFCRQKRRTLNDL